MSLLLLEGLSIFRCKRGLHFEDKDEETHFFAVNNISYSIAQKQPKDFRRPGNNLESPKEKLHHSKTPRIPRYTVVVGPRSKTRGKYRADLREYSNAVMRKIEIADRRGDEEQTRPQHCSASEMNDYSNSVGGYLCGGEAIHHEEEIADYALQHRNTTSAQCVQEIRPDKSSLYRSDNSELEVDRLDTRAPPNVFNRNIPGIAVTANRLRSEETDPTKTAEKDPVYSMQEIKTSNYTTTDANVYDSEQTAGTESKYDAEQAKIMSETDEQFTFDDHTSSPFQKDSLYRKKMSRRAVQKKKRGNQSTVHG